MRKTWIYAAIGLVLSSCAGAEQSGGAGAESQPAQLYKGLYATGKFISCDNQVLDYTVNDQTGTLDSLYSKLLPYGYSKQSIYVELMGSMPANRAKDILVVTEVVKAEEKNATNVCVPYDFWCRGNEPFWMAEISEAEGLIDITLPMEQRVIHFEYAPPVTEGNKTVYLAKTDSTFAQLTIRSEFCTDGMSEKRYNFSVELITEGKTLKGCAVNYSEPK